jgi:hypothetical protein
VSRTLRLVVLLAGALLFCLSCSGTSRDVASTPSPAEASSASEPGVPVVAAGQTCFARGILPDPNCTPGVPDPRVTQDNIHSTICLSGYTRTVRPTSSYTNRLKAEQMKAYGFTDRISAHEEDHLISLELGGDPRDPKNLARTWSVTEPEGSD